MDDNGLVWMGSQDGDVFTYDPQTNKVENLSDMFDMLEEGIFNIITDQLGHIWISTNKRVIEYDPKNGGIMDYSTMTDVMVNSFMPNSYYKTRSGKYCMEVIKESQYLLLMIICLIILVELERWCQMSR